MPKITLQSAFQVLDKKMWRYQTLRENLTRCYNNNLYTDAVIKIRDKGFQAHKSILSFYSPIFQKAFYGTKIASSTCILNEMKPEGFAVLLRYLYCSEVPVKVDVNDLVEACYAAQILEMVGIMEKLVNHIFIWKTPWGLKNSGKTIAELQFWPLLKKSRLLSFGHLQEQLLKFAESHFTRILENEGFIGADSETIKLVFDRKPPGVSEIYMLENIACWKESNLNLETSDQFVQELLKCVNWKVLSPREFYSVVSKHGNLLPAKDSLDILMHLVDSTVCPLPMWCQFDDKALNILTDREAESKTDKFKSLGDLRITNDLSLTATHHEKLKKAFQSQEDLRNNLDKWTEGKPSTVAKLLGKTLQESFYQMLEEGLFTDVTLIAKEGTEIPAHRLVLALGSEFFQNTFYRTIPSPKTLRVEETADEVKEMLRYFYGCGKTSVYGSPLESILVKTDMALKYLCYPLMAACNNALSRMTLDPSSFWTLANWVDELSHSKVDTKALMAYAATETKELFEHDSFCGASKKSLEKVLKSDYLNVAEGDILEYVARWMEENVKQLPTDNCKKEILANIRFEALGAEEFFAFLNKHEELLPIRDSFSVLEFLFRRREGSPLPDWCYRGPLRSVFYDCSMKIGTNVPVQWSGSPDKGKRMLRCMFTVTIRDKLPKSEIQFLELSLIHNIGSFCSDCVSRITITTDNGCEPLTFSDLAMSQKQRCLVPVSFCLDSSHKPKIDFVLQVDVKHPHKFYSLRRRTLEFDNVVFVETSGDTNYLCDAIVDGFTSENVRFPEHLLSKNRDAVVATENFLTITSETTS